jgi:hypothetical protein
MVYHTEWVEMKRVHQAAVDEWTAVCAELMALGSRKKNLPPKPKLGKKPTLAEPADDPEDEKGDGEPDFHDF